MRAITSTLGPTCARLVLDALSLYWNASWHASLFDVQDGTACGRSCSRDSLNTSKWNAGGCRGLRPHSLSIRSQLVILRRWNCRRYFTACIIEGVSLGRLRRGLQGFLAQVVRTTIRSSASTPGTIGMRSWRYFLGGWGVFISSFS